MTDMMTIRFLVAFLLLAGAVACNDQDVNAVNVPTEAAVELDAAEISEDSLGTAASPTNKSRTVAASQILTSEHPNLVALSIEEATWLDRHGYPTAEELAQLRSFDVDVLESAMRNRKDVKAAALLGHRRALEGDLAGAASAFSAAAGQGSLYARQQLAIANMREITGLTVEQFSQADQGALVILLAQFEMTRLLGDHRAQSYINRFGSDFDWRSYGKHVLDQTAEFMRQYGNNARAVGVRPVGPDPRPNADLWTKLGTDPNAMVTVYERSQEGG